MTICMILWFASLQQPAPATTYALANSLQGCNVAAQHWPGAVYAYNAWHWADPDAATQLQLCGPQLRDCPDLRGAK